MHRSCTFADGEAEMAFWSTDDDGVGFAWHMRDKDNLCKVQLNATPPFWQVSRTVDGKFRCIATGTTGYRMGELHRLRVRSADSMTAIELDGRLLFVGTVDGPESGSVAIESRGNQGTHADYVRVTSGKPWTDQELGSLRELHVMHNARLEHLAVLPGETLRLELPDTSDSTAVVRADGRELARAPLSGKRIDLWRNPGGMDTLGEVVLLSGGKEARALPFNIWTAWPKGIGVCAHRGDNHMAPENTVPAIRLAVQKRAHEIEIDVTRTKDGHLVLLHDPTLDRTTDGTGKPQDYTLAELKQLDAGSWKDATWKGTRIPTLEEALAEIPDGIWVNLHLKTGVAEDVTRLVTRLERTQWCFLACSQAEATQARRINPDILVCNMDGQAGPSSTYPRRTMDMKADFLQFHGFDETMPRVARELAAHGVRRNYFPANDPAFFRRLLEAGVEFPLTDRLDTMLGVLDEIGVPPPALTRKLP
jgi:glycerophosphoryl diester phosphodiesterase